MDLLGDPLLLVEGEGHWCDDVVEVVAGRLDAGDDDLDVGVEQEPDHHHGVLALLDGLLVSGALVADLDVGLVREPLRHRA